jgi:D-alanyl-lipoteichoic acid acyltransferase DltB (MBOAT superfamily)
MPYLSFEFAALLAAAVLTFYAIRPSIRRHYLLALSYAFYATWSPRYLALLIAATCLVWVAGRRVAPSAPGAEPGPTERRWLWSSVVGLFGLLFAFKYLPAIAPGSRVASLVAPLGISYYTFRLTSYLVEVYWGKPPARDFVSFALYVAFFPQIVSGPIQRADDFLPQVESPRPFDADRITGGLRLILFGAFEKFVVANRIEVVANSVFDAPGRASGAAFLVAAYAYAIQLYADFSGLTDIAIGIGRLFGLESPPNFDNPFYSPNIQVFWRRWHMTLTSWLRDYLFAPLHLALRDLGEPGLFIAIFVNMIAIGAWHRASWNMILFGVLNGVYVIASSLTLKRRNKFFKGRPALSKVRAVVDPVVTFTMIAIALVFFRAATLRDALLILRHLVPSHAPAWGLRGIGLQAFGIPGVLAIVAMEIVHLARASGALRRALDSSPRWVRWSVYYAVIGSILALGQVGAQGFIYGRF